MTWHFHEAPSKRYTLAEAQRILMGQWKANLEKSEDRFGRTPLHDTLAGGLLMTFSAKTFNVDYDGRSSHFTNTTLEGPSPDEHFTLNTTDDQGTPHVEELQILDNDHIIFKVAGKPAVVLDRVTTKK